MIAPRASFGAAILGSQLFAVGGARGNSEPTTEVLDLGKSGDQQHWKLNSNLTFSRKNHGVMAMGGELWAVGGDLDNLERTNTVEGYEPERSLWSLRGSMSTTRASMGLAAIFGGSSGRSDGEIEGVADISFLYAVGGEQELYTPSADRMRHRVRQPNKRCDLTTQTEAVNAECCNEPTEDCSSGRPTSCNVGCAGVLLPFFNTCSEALGNAATDFNDVVSLCRAAQGGLAR
eukprot:SAG11_NODE_1527_length_4740_cov_20.044172_2_plen_232_part_00